MHLEKELGDLTIWVITKIVVLDSFSVIKVVKFKVILTLFVNEQTFLLMFNFFKKVIY